MDGVAGLLEAIAGRLVTLVRQLADVLGPIVPDQLVRALMLARQELAGSAVVVLGTLALIGLCAVLALAGRRAAALALVPLALLWPLVDQRIEGPTLLVLSWNHGLSTADLLTPLALVIALIGVVRSRRPVGVQTGRIDRPAE